MCGKLVALFVMMAFVVSAFAEEEDFLVGNFELASDLKDPIIREFLHVMEFKEQVLKIVEHLTHVKLEITKDGTKYTSKSLSNVMNREHTFEIGKDYEETLIDGRKCKGTVTKDGNTMETIMDCGGKAQAKQVAVLSKEGMDVTATANGVTGHFKFKRV